MHGGDGRQSTQTAGAFNANQLGAWESLQLTFYLTLTFQNKTDDVKKSDQFATTCFFNTTDLICEQLLSQVVTALDNSRHQFPVGEMSVGRGFPDASHFRFKLLLHCSSRWVIRVSKEPRRKMPVQAFSQPTPAQIAINRHDCELYAITSSQTCTMVNCKAGVSNPWPAGRFWVARAFFFRNDR